MAVVAPGMVGELSGDWSLRLRGDLGSLPAGEILARLAAACVSPSCVTVDVVNEDEETFALLELLLPPRILSMEKLECVFSPLCVVLVGLVGLFDEESLLGDTAVLVGVVGGSPRGCG